MKDRDMTNKGLILIIATLCLSACASHEPQYAKACQHHNFQLGTNSYEQCLNLLRDKHKEEQHQQMARMVGEIIAAGVIQNDSSYHPYEPPKSIKLDKKTTAALNKL